LTDFRKVLKYQIL